MAEDRITAVIVDDEPFVRHALRAYLQTEDIEVLGEADSGQAGLDLVAAEEPDVVLLDLQMPDLDGIEVTRRLGESHPDTRVIVVSAHVSDRYVVPALLAGASGYVVKDSEQQRIIDAVRGAMEGGLSLDPTVTKHLVEYVGRGAHVPAEPAVELTEREHEVLTQLCSGRSNKEMAGSLYIAESTVKYYLSHLMQKFGSRDRVQLVVAAFRSGAVT